MRSFRGESWRLTQDGSYPSSSATNQETEITVQRALVGESSRVPFVRAALEHLARAASNSPSKLGWSNRLDRSPRIRREGSSDIEFGTEGVRRGHCLPFTRPESSRFVRIFVPIGHRFEAHKTRDGRPEVGAQFTKAGRTALSVGSAASGGIRIFRVTERTRRDVSAEELIDENQRQPPFAGIADALPTSVQFAKSLSSVMANQAVVALASVHVDSTALGLGEETINATPLTRPMGCAVTREWRPTVRLLTLARNGDCSIRWASQSSEEVASTKRLGEANAMSRGRILAPSFVVSAGRKSCASAASARSSVDSAGHPFPIAVLSHWVSVCVAVRRERFWHEYRNSRRGLPAADSSAKSRLLASPTSLARRSDVRASVSRFSSETHVTTVSSYSR